MRGRSARGQGPAAVTGRAAGLAVAGAAAAPARGRGHHTQRELLRRYTAKAYQCKLLKD